MGALLEKDIKTLDFPLGHIMKEYKYGDVLHEYFVSQTELIGYTKDDNVKKILILKENADL